MLETLQSTSSASAGSGVSPAPAEKKPSTSVRSTVDGRTMSQAYLRRVEVSGNELLFRLKREGKYIDISWSEAHAKVLGIFHSLRQAGIKNGDRVCIASQSRPEWFLCDFAIMSLGAITVPIYHSSSVDDIAFMLKDCGASLVFGEDDAQCRKLEEAMALNGLKIPIVVFAPKALSASATAFGDFSKPAPEAEADFRKSVANGKESDVASIVYTSGTTGRPKGAVLLQSCFTSELRAIADEVDLHDDMTVTFLPFAHILGRVESYLPVFAGTKLGFAESINSVAQNITEIRPTLLVSVPRIYEKIYSKIQSEVESQPELKKNIFKWAVSVGREVARLRSEARAVPIWLLAKHKVADKLVFSKIRAKLGGNVRLSVSGGAPLSAELCELFHACGIKILEGYGLTETTGAIAVNRPDNYEFGTVGKPMPGIDIRIAEDGEIQIKGPMVFKEYYRNPEATRDVFTSDGWFCTGDIGEITPRGNLKITDRKKELIVTSGGKKIAPQKLENMIKSSRFLSNGMVYGDKQKYLIALVTLNESEVRTWAKLQGIEASAPAELVRHSKVVDLVDAELKGINQQLASYESIKRFRIVPQDFTVETGELTPSLKLKRKICVEKYRSLIDDLYS